MIRIFSSYLYPFSAYLKRISLATIPLILIVAIGCSGPIHTQKNLVLEVGIPNTLTFTGSKDQHIKLKIVTDQPLTLYVAASKDMNLDDGDSLILAPKSSYLQLQNVQSGEFEFVIREKGDFTLCFYTLKRTAHSAITIDSM